MKNGRVKKYLALALAVVSLYAVVPAAGAAQSQGGAILDEGTDVCAPVKDNGDTGDHLHGSTIVRLPDGEMLCAWFQGNGERDGHTVRIMAARKPVGGSDWGEPFVLADTPRMADINPALYVDQEDTLWLFWYPVLGSRWESSQPKYLKAEAGHYEGAQGFDGVPDWTWQDAIYVKVGGNWSPTGESDKVDDGVTAGRYNDTYTQWLKEQYDSFAEYTFKPVEEGGAGTSEAFFGAKWADFVTERLKLSLGKLFAAKDKVPYARRWGWQTKDKPFEFQWEGHTRMLLPLYSDTMECAIVAISDNGGETWDFSKPIIGMPVIQASILQKTDGTLVAYLRDNGDLPKRVAVSESTDGGMTWSIAKDHPGLFDPGVGSDLAELPNGNWVFVHNDNQQGRSSLTVALSEDEGETWTYRRHVALDTRASAASFHYPAIITDEDGTIYISYTVDYSDLDGDLAHYNHIKYVEIDEDWIKAGDEEKLIYSFERAVHLVDGSGLQPEDFVEGKLPTEKLAELGLPATLKGYWTYTEKLADGMNTYAELPILWDAATLAVLQEKFGNGNYDKALDITVTVDRSKLPAGVTEDMLPDMSSNMKLMITEKALPAPAALELEAPVEELPTIEEPVAEKPTTEEPTTEEPTTEEPNEEGPSIGEGEDTAPVDGEQETVDPAETEA